MYQVSGEKLQTQAVLMPFSQKSVYIISKTIALVPPIKISFRSELSKDWD